MVNLSALDNISPLVLNITILQDIEQTIPRAAEVANTSTNGTFAIWISLIFFLILVIGLFRRDGDIRLDITRTLFKSSGLTFIVMLVMATSGLISNIKPLLWFFTIWLLLAMILMWLRSKNKI